MNKLGMVKTVGGVIVSVGVSAIVGNTIKSTTPSTVGLVKKACIIVGGFVLSSMISDKASDYAEQKIDDAADMVKKLTVGEESTEEVKED